MVVYWSSIAENRLKGIFDYYFSVAGNRVALKLVTRISKSADLLGLMPYMAPVEKDLTGMAFVYRSLVVNKIFKVVYFVDEQSECVVVATVWDCRQNPEELKNEINI